jgi:hypothetical protein
MPPLDTVQSVGTGFTATFSHPLILAGAAISLQGFKLDSDFIDMVQLMDNSKVQALVGGGTATITNSVKAGSATFNSVRVSTNLADGDVVLIATTLQGLGDSVGGQIRITNGLNGSTDAITLIKVVVKSCPLLKLAGNDLAVYPVVFNYADFARI